MNKKAVREFCRRTHCKVFLVRWRRVVRNVSQVEVIEEDDEMPGPHWLALKALGKRAPTKIGEQEP